MGVKQTSIWVAATPPTANSTSTPEYSLRMPGLNSPISLLVPVAVQSVSWQPVTGICAQLPLPPRMASRSSSLPSGAPDLV